MEVREKNILENEKLFRSVINNSLDSFSLLDSEGNILFTGPATQRLLGHVPADRIGKNIFDSVPAEFQGYAKKAFLEVISQPGKSIVVECPYKHADGHPLWLEITAVNLLNDKDVGAIVTNYRDITEKKKIAESLRKSEERYRLLFESNPIPMWVFDADSFSFLAVNDSAVEHYGYSREEFLSMSIKDIRPPEDVAAIDLIHNIAKHLTGLITEGIWKHRKKNGSLIDVEITKHLFRFEEKNAMLVLANDVTVKKNAEEEVRKNEQKYRSLIESLPVPLIYVDCDDGLSVRYANEHFCTLTGYRLEELEESRGLDILVFNENIRALKSTVEAPSRSGIQIRKKDGEVLQLHARLTPCMEDDNKKSGCWILILLPNEAKS